jgi:hypothetical protein
MNDVERLATVERAVAAEGIAVELGLSEDTARGARRPRLREVPSANEPDSVDGGLLCMPQREYTEYASRPAA